MEVEEDPMERVKTAMQAKGLAELEGACPVCFENQRALWCAQTVPKCGSYSANIENVLLPALSKVTTAQMEGEDSAQSLSAALPELLTASSLAMPCRQVTFKSTEQSTSNAVPVNSETVLSMLLPITTLFLC